MTPPLPAPRGRVLVCDDEAALLELLRVGLTQRGFQVGVAHGGQQALQVWADLGGAGCLITDLRMPDMDGRELARQLRLQQPGLPVLFISGWDPQGGNVKPDPDPLVAHLEKPFRFAELYRVMDRFFPPSPQP